MNDGENGAGRLAGLELGGKWMCKEIAFCTLFVRLQGITKNLLEIWGRVGGGHGVWVTHGGVKRTMVGWATLGDSKRSLVAEALPRVGLV
jgi:hypothetical protein